MANSAQLNRIERKLDAIIEHFDIPFEDTTKASKEVADLLREGKKINAIKVYREQTGVGLKEAKEAIDAMGRDGLF